MKYSEQQLKTMAETVLVSLRRKDLRSDIVISMVAVLTRSSFEQTVVRIKELAGKT